MIMWTTQLASIQRKFYINSSRFHRRTRSFEICMLSVPRNCFTSRHNTYIFSCSKYDIFITTKKKADVQQGFHIVHRGLNNYYVSFLPSSHQSVWQTMYFQRRISQMPPAFVPQRWIERNIFCFALSLASIELFFILCFVMPSFISGYK